MHGEQRQREALSGLILIGPVWGGGVQRGQGVRADECLVILQRGLRGRDGERRGVV